MGLRIKILVVLGLFFWGVFGVATFVQAVGEVKEACVLSTVLEDNGDPIQNDSWFLPDCVYFEGTEKQQQCGCRNINVFIDLLINVANKILMVVGGVALLMFIYGGFVMLTSAGASESVKKGKETLVAAVIGLVIIFSAQLLLNFVLNLIVGAGGEAGGNKNTSVQGTQIIVPK